jgi:hypothetical protein
MTFRQWFVCILCLGLNLVQAAGQANKGQTNKPIQPYALIFGTVWGPDARPVYRVQVKIRRQDEKKARWEVYSDHSGEFAQRVPAGKADYVIATDPKGVKLQNGQRLHADEVTVHVEYDERVDTGLHLK